MSLTLADENSWKFCISIHSKISLFAYADGKIPTENTALKNLNPFIPQTYES